MKCRKCHQEIPEESKFCMFCGAIQQVSHNTKSRGNGTGTVFKRGKTWTACRVIGYTTEIIEDENGKHKKIHKVTKSKGGFCTKKDALKYLPKLFAEDQAKKSMTWQKMYETWKPTHRAGKSTMSCYASAEKYFKPVWHMQFDKIDIDDLQECLDDCPKGKRTRENMKTLAGLLYKYAIPRHMATLNIGEYLVVGGGDVSERAALPSNALDAIKRASDHIQGADYVLAQCYLGFRPSEFLALDVLDYNREERAFTGGAKTDAGIDRVVTVSPKIQHIIDKLIKDKTSGPVFCGPNGKQMTIEQYRALFYSVLDACEIENPIEGPEGAKRHRYTPHSCRHTFATLMKRVEGADKDKLALIGHTSNEMLRHYQDVSYDDLRKVTDAI